MHLRPIEDRVRVAGRLVGVPRPRDDPGREQGDQDGDGDPASLADPDDRHRDEHEHHDRERPQRERPHELRCAERCAEGDGVEHRPRPTDDHARGEHERQGAEEHRHRLRVHHRRRPRGQHAEDEEAERGEVETTAAREDEPRQLEQEHGSREQQSRVDQLDDPERLPEPDFLAEPDRARGDRVEPRRRVVLPDPVGEPLAVENSLCVGDVLGGVVPEAGRVAQDVPRGDHRQHGEEPNRGAAVAGDHPAWAIDRVGAHLHAVTGRSRIAATSRAPAGEVIASGRSGAGSTGSWWIELIRRTPPRRCRRERRESP